MKYVKYEGKFLLIAEGVIFIVGLVLVVLLRNKRDLLEFALFLLFLVALNLPAAVMWWVGWREARRLRRKHSSLHGRWEEFRKNTGG